MSTEVEIRERLLETLDMFSFGVEMKASSLRRRYPDAPPEKIEQFLADWLARLDDGTPPDELRVVTDRYR